jgi:hypothetical protein
MRPFSRNSDVSRATSSCTQRQADAATPHRAVPSCPLESSRVSSRSERSAHSGRTSTRSCGGTSRLWEIYKFQTSPGATTTYMASFDPGGRCLPALDFRRCDVPLGRTKPELIKKLEPGQRGWDRLTEMKLACGTSWNENLATRSNYARYSQLLLTRFASRLRQRYGQPRLKGHDQPVARRAGHVSTGRSHTTRVPPPCQLSPLARDTPCPRRPVPSCHED